MKQRRHCGVFGVQPSSAEVRERSRQGSACLRSAASQGAGSLKSAAHRDSTRWGIAASKGTPSFLFWSYISLLFQIASYSCFRLDLLHTTPRLKTWISQKGCSPSDPSASWKASPPNSLHIGGLRRPNPLHFGGCASKPLHLEAAPPKPLLDCSVSTFRIQSNGEATAEFSGRSIQVQWFGSAAAKVQDV